MPLTNRRNFLRLAGSVVAAAVVPIRTPMKAVVDFSFHQGSYTMEVWFNTRVVKDSWHHLAMVREGGEERTFLDGTLAEPQSLSHVDWQRCLFDELHIRRLPDALRDAHDPTDEGSA